MSKPAKVVIVFLSLLVAAASGLAMFTVMQKEKIMASNIVLKQQVKKQIKGYQSREEKYIFDNNDLRNEIGKLEALKSELEIAKKQLEKEVVELKTSKTKLEGRLSNTDVSFGELDDRIKTLIVERDDWKVRVDNLQKEREDLLVQLKEKPKEIIVTEPIDREPEGKEETPPPFDDESYWAQVLKKKAQLEVELEEIKVILAKSVLKVSELKKKNSDLQLNFSKLETEKEFIEREIKHGNDLSNTLSLELTRAQNEKRFLNEHVEKVSGDNTHLHTQVKKLTATKIALEKSIIHLQEEKRDLERKMYKTDDVIQNRIDEIQNIQDLLDKTFKFTSGITSDAGINSNEVELTPIVVSAQAMMSDFVPNIAAQAPVGLGGNIVSINEENNFVIIDVGEQSGIKLGDVLNVYRNAQYVAGLEVIQVRKDIAAADIKNKIVKIQVGDAVR